jgi:hypothetical protein
MFKNRKKIKRLFKFWWFKALFVTLSDEVEALIRPPFSF